MGCAMADLMQQARELLAAEIGAPVTAGSFAGTLPAGVHADAALRAIAAALRAAPTDLAERHAAAERDASRWARIAEEHRNGMMEALEEAATLAAELRAAMCTLEKRSCLADGQIAAPVEPTPEMLVAGWQKAGDFGAAVGPIYKAMLAARPQGVPDAG